MDKVRKNYALLALAIVYGIIAIMQMTAPGILAMQLYFSVAFISLSTTLCELIKSCINWICTNRSTITSITVDGTEIIKKDMELINQYPSLSNLKEHLQIEYDNLSKYLESKKKTPRDELLGKIDSIISFVEILDILSMSIITSLKIVPNNFATNKVINVVSLLSVAFAFLSIYMNDSISNDLECLREKNRIYCHISNYYLDIIKKISENPSVQESEAIQDDNH